MLKAENGKNKYMKCVNCFEETGNELVCPQCGYNSSEYVKQPHYMVEGSTLQNGRYIVGRSVGAGGFGVTYVAWDNSFNVKVAIKEYLPGEFSTRIGGATQLTIYGGEKQEQFADGLVKYVEEGVRLAKFRDVEGIVKIFDTFKENGTAYIVMEYLEGETLAKRLEREGKIPVQEAIDIIVPVLDALSEVHNKGVIHRDIAPNNIFLCTDGRVKLIDFGASRSATGTHSKSLTVLYKQGFTAVEQYQSRGEQGPWTDVYSVAATLYDMITGVVPEGAMERSRKDSLKKISRYGIKIKKNSEKAIMNALNINFKNRTQSAAQFKEELLSNQRVKNRFERINEKKIGSIPVSFVLLSLTLIIGVSTFIGLISFGIIEFESEEFSELFMEKGKSRVISLINMNSQEAEERLAKLGFKMDVELEYSNTVLDKLKAYKLFKCKHFSFLLYQ